MALGRVGNNHLTRMMLSRIQGQSSLQERLFEQVSSNRRINRASDDPLGTSSAMNLRDTAQRYDGYEKAINEANTWTNISTANLDSAVDTWKRVNEIAINAADGSKTAEDRAGMAEEVEQLLEHMVQIANSTHGGRYVFGGNASDQPAFRSETDPVTGRITGVFYQGDDQIRKVTTQDGGSVGVNVVGSNAGNPNVPGVFVDSNSGVDVFATAIALRDKLLNNDTIGLSGEGGIISEIEAGAQSLTSAQVRLGGTQQVLELDKNLLVDQNALVEQSLSDVEQADTVQLILELNNVQNVYEAALSASGRLLQTGLINYI